MTVEVVQADIEDFLMRVAWVCKTYGIPPELIANSDESSVFLLEMKCPEIGAS